MTSAQSCIHRYYSHRSTLVLYVHLLPTYNIKDTLLKLCPPFSAISYSHKILDHSDPTSAFIVSKFIAGAYRRRPSFDSRFPITVEILNQTVRSVNHTFEGLYDQCLYKAMFLFAFNTFARIGEFTYPGNNVLQFQDVEFGGEKQNQSVMVTFNNFKHNMCGKPHNISFNASPSEISAVLALKMSYKNVVHSQVPYFVLC